MFEKLTKLAFQPRKVLKVLFVPFLSRVHKLIKIYLADGLYPVKYIETALKEVFGINRNILDFLYITFISTRVGLFIVTIRELSSCIFTNYNGVRSRE
jgi:hypothetical protein